MQLIWKGNPVPYRHSRWEAVRVHDHVRTDAIITEWHVLLVYN